MRTEHLPTVNSIRALLIGYFILIAIIPIVVFGYMGYSNIVSQAEGMAGDRVRAAADHVARAVSAFMNERASDSLVWARLWVIREALSVREVREDATNALRELRKYYDAYDAILILDHSGTCIVSSRPGLVGRDFSKGQAFTNAVKGRLHFQDMHVDKNVKYFNPQSNGFSLKIAAPIRIGGKVSGVLVSYMNWSSLENVVRGIRMGESGRIRLLGKHGTVIADEDRKLYLKPLAKLGFGAIDRALAAGKELVIFEVKDMPSGRLDRHIAGLAYLKGHRWFPNMGWKVVVDIEESEVLAALPNIVRDYGIIAAVTVGVVVWVAVLISGVTARQFSQVSGTGPRA